MPRSSEATRQRILEAAYDLFYAQGFSRVGVDAVAARAGITKRTLYAHFESKDELLGSVLELQHELALARLRRWAEGLVGPVDVALDGLFDELGRWASHPRWTGAGFTRLAMELADLPGHPARAVARRHKASIEAWLAELLGRDDCSDAEAVARQVMILVEGAIALVVIHGDQAYLDEAARAARQMLNLQRPPPSEPVSRDMLGATGTNDVRGP